MRRFRPRLQIIWLWLLAIAAVAGLPAHAQDYPANPVKLITQGAPGSGPDVIARILADHLGRLWGQQVLVLSHPGAAGSAAARVAAAAPPDGYTLYMPATSAFVVMPRCCRICRRLEQNRRASASSASSR